MDILHSARYRITSTIETEWTEYIVKDTEYKVLDTEWTDYIVLDTEYKVLDTEYN